MPRARTRTTSHQTPPRRARQLTLLATSLGFAVIQLDVSVVNVAIKPIGSALGGGISGLQWVVSAYTVAFAALILTAGALGDRLGARRIFLAGFAAFTAASAAGGLAPTLSVLIAARAAQGLGAAMLAPASLSLLNHAFTEPGERTRAVGLWAAGASTALAGGPLIGGVLTAALGWRAIFFINAPVGLFGIALTLRYAAETSRSPGRALDLPGQFAAIACLTALAGATIEGGRDGFAGVVPLAGYAAAVVAGTAFVAIESRVRQPMLPLGLFRTPAFGVVAAIGLLINIAFYGLIFVLSLYFQRTQHLSALTTGLAFAPATAAILAANLRSGRLQNLIGARQAIALGAGLMAAGTAGLLGIGPGSDYAVLLAPLVVVGLGLGLIVPAITASILGSVPRERSGIASGTLNTARQTGSVIGVALFGALIGNPGHLVAGLHVALAISVGLASAVAALTRALPTGAASPPPKQGG